jgi:hypothetical protein
MLKAPVAVLNLARFNKRSHRAPSLNLTQAVSSHVTSVEVYNTIEII